MPLRRHLSFWGGKTGHTVIGIELEYCAMLVKRLVIIVALLYLAVKEEYTVFVCSSSGNITLRREKRGMANNMARATPAWALPGGAGPENLKSIQAPILNTNELSLPK